MDIQKYLIDKNKTVIQAMRQLDKEACRVLFLLENGKLQAAISDGDVRRWIVNGGALNAPVSEIANYHPKYLVDQSRADAQRYLRSQKIEVVPIVDEELRIKEIVSWNEVEEVEEEEEKLISLPVVMMAGGKGTRLYPYTKILPKPLIPVGDIPIAEHIIQRFYKAGCQHFILIVNHKKNMIKAYFNEIERDYEISFVDEEQPLGTGGGLSLLKGQINETFILTNCDILLDADFSKIYQFHKEHNNVITMVCALQNIQIPYGVVHMGNGGTIESMQEKPEISFFTNTGCYIVEPEVVDSIEEGKAIDFPEIADRFRKDGRNVGVFPIGEKAWMDMGQMDELEKMRKRLTQE